ncbi:MAG: glutathione synthase [Oleiphilaceae bacterium]|nr:glutathione synthase [Oleiphilaceae bacterium]
MSIKLGIVMDPIAGISFKKDTSLALLLAAQKRGWELFYMEMDDLYLENGKARARVQGLEVANDPQRWYRLGESCEVDLGGLDVILMRKDPPVDREFLMATYILEAAERDGAYVVNPPAALRDCNEKLFATQFPQCTPPGLVSRNPDRIRAFCREQGDVILKPIDGMGGSSIFRIKPGDKNLGVVIETLTRHGKEQIMVQKFIPAIDKGDKRILLIDGEPLPFSLARIPSAEENRGNLAAGGRGEGRELSDRDRWICEQVRPAIQARGLMFVGLDVIGDYLTEINVTSPTCVRELDRAFDVDISSQLMDAIEKRLEQRS